MNTKQTKTPAIFFVEITDTFGGDASYTWVRRYLVRSVSERGAISRVSREHGYRFRHAYHERYNAVGAHVCAFVTYVDPSEIDQYEGTETL